MNPILMYILWVSLILGSLTLVGEAAYGCRKVHVPPQK
jgi:hypothetical protein